MMSAGGVVATTPSESANPNGTRRGAPGVNAELSEKLTIVSAPELDGLPEELALEPPVDELDDDVPLLPQAASTAALAPASRNDRRSRRSGI